MSEYKNTIISKGEKDSPIKAVLVGLVAREERTAADTMEEAEKSLDELERLLDTAGGETFARMIQKTTPDPAPSLARAR